MQKISIVLPTYAIDLEVEQTLNRFLETLNNSEDILNYELVVIEQGKKTGVEQYANRYIHFENPIGYARAVNLGIALAQGDYIVVLNNDLELPDKWLDRLVADYENEMQGQGLLSMMDYEKPGIHENESWYSGWIISRKTWQAVGYFDETINYRFHDQDYSIRLKKAGFRLARTGNVLVVHKESTTYKKMNRNEDPEEQEIMIKRHGCLLFSEWIKNQK